MRSFLPARMLLPLILLSFLSFFTVVPLRFAISESVSPCRMVTFFERSFLFFFLREERVEREELLYWRVEREELLYWRVERDE